MRVQKEAPHEKFAQEFAKDKTAESIVITLAQPGFRPTIERTPPAPAPCCAESCSRRPPNPSEGSGHFDFIQRHKEQGLGNPLCRYKERVPKRLLSVPTAVRRSFESSPYSRARSPTNF